MSGRHREPGHEGNSGHGDVESERKLVTTAVKPISA